eukprot:358937-Chlamydomonas_euryale.AAC.12
MQRLDVGGVLRWTIANNVCGPKSSIVVIVGWNMYAPPAYQIFGCDPGPAGVRLPPMCRCT